MCGIFVAFNKDGASTGDEGFRAATGAVLHRGPDNIGFFSDDTCFLGHTRLSILGLEASGNQPFYFEDLVMVFNGEVFNFIELREELENLGYAFETHSDTEVVLKAFHRWGAECFPRFNGMWSLAIYDRKSKSLTVSRDRFGQKPLFSMHRNGADYFASEFQQLVPISNREIDYELIQAFLKEGGYESRGRTFLASVEEFPKAHFCTIARTGDISCQRYWDYWTGKITKVDDRSFVEFEALLRDSIKLRLRADVPYGVLLSGGVDSTVVAAYARELDVPEKFIPAYTYSSKYGDDEAAHAQAAADKLGMPLTIREQEPNPEEYRERLRRIVKHMGRGHSSPAIVSVDYLYESVGKSGIKVALDGQGADELLAGYKTYFPILIPKLFFTGRFGQAMASLKEARRYGVAACTVFFLRNILPEAAKKIGRRLYGYERFFRSFSSAPGARRIEPAKPASGNKSALNAYLIRQHDIGLSNLLFYGDIVAMRHSVENRSPFMDHRLVDFVFSRGDALKVWNGQDKYALRSLSILEKFRDVLERKKMGFASPIKRETKAFMAEELKTSPILRWPIFTPQLIAFIENKGFDSAKFEPLLFRLYQVHLWNDVFINNAAAVEAIVPVQRKKEFE
jgi:asparagine synthase (glutamine-hydrolysing)